jgi:hypothetical protein
MPAKRPTPVEKTAEQAKSFPMAEADISQQAVTQTEPAVKPVEVVDPAPKRVDKTHTTGKMGAKTAATPRSDEKAQPTPAKPLSTPVAESPVKKQAPRGKPAASKGKPGTKPKSNRRKKGKRR